MCKQQRATQAYPAMKGSAGRFLGLITGEEELPSIWPWERCDLGQFCVGAASPRTPHRAVIGTLSRSLLAALGPSHGHHLWEQDLTGSPGYHTPRLQCRQVSSLICVHCSALERPPKAGRGAL